MALSFVPIEGGRLAFERAGAGPPLVLLHGLGLDKGAWAGVARLLEGRFDTIRLDLRGHGDSSPWDGPYVPHDDVARAFDTLGLARAHVAGLSQGGAVALDLALAHPARVRSLALVDAVLGGHRWSDAYRDSIRAIRARGRAEGAEAARAAWAAHPLFAGIPDATAWLARDSGRRWIERDPARGLDPPAAGRLGEVHAATLVVVGARDLPDFQAMARALADGIPGARRIVLEGIGHLAPLEAPSRVAQLIAEHAARA